MFIESQQVQQKAQSAQTATNSIKTQIANLNTKVSNAASMNDVVALLKELPQLTTGLQSTADAAVAASAEVLKGAVALVSSIESVIPKSNGLVGMYFGDVDLGGIPKLRIDTAINFVWPSGSKPMTDVPATFSVRWVGKVKAKVSGQHKIIANSDDGVRVWINGQQIISDWTSHAAKDFSGTFTFAKDAMYDITIEYQNSGGQGSIKLYWEANGLTKEIVPSSHLFTK